MRCTGVLSKLNLIMLCIVQIATSEVSSRSLGQEIAQIL